MPTSSDLVTDLPADFEVFGQAVDTSLADLKGGTTGQVLAKNSNTDMDFVWTAGGDITGVTAGTGISGGGTSGDVTITNSMATAITTNGDLIYGTGSGTFTRRGIGTTGQVLGVSGGVPTWVTPSTGGLAMSEIATGTPSGSSLSITGLSNYDQIDFFVYSLTHTINDNLLFRINSNTGGNYAQGVMIQKGSTTDFTRGTAETSFLLTPNDAKGATQSNHVLWVRLTNCKSTGFTSAEYNHYYRDSAGGGYINMQMGTYKVAEAVSSIQLVVASGSFNGGSYVVYGG